MPSSLERYFDHAASTPVDPRVRDAMLPYLGESCGNAHSIHSWGQQARDAVERARVSVARLLGAESSEEVVFTSGATESNNWVLRSFADVAIGPFEHSSVREPALHLGLQVLSSEGSRTIPPDRRFELISHMAVNNETGAVYDLRPLAERCDRLHCDATQALGKVPFSVETCPCAFASCSAHKIYGPKGVGALYARGAEFPDPLLRGGEHEVGRRAGTLNVPGIVGFGVAAEIADAQREADFRHAAELRSCVLEGLGRLPDFIVNGGESASPFILSISFLEVEGESVVIELDRLGFAVSSGAACSSGSTEPSHVLVAMGTPPEWLRGTVRISFGRANTVESAKQLSSALCKVVGTLRALKV